MSEIVIFDPGLEGNGGHHDSVALTLQNYVSGTSTKLKIKILGHATLSESFVKNCPDLTITPHFQSRFYQYYFFEQRDEQYTRYVATLAREYIDAIKASVTFSSRTESLLLFHSIDYIHADALALALSSIRLASHIKVLVLQMYHPLREGSEYAKLHYHYHYAITRLAKIAEVSLWAADLEIALAISDILEQNVPVHPCLLALDSSLIPNKQNTHIIFTGDAKFEKGFTKLPELLSALNVDDENAKFIVQFTLNNNNPELNSSAEKIRDIAAINPRLVLIERYLSEARIQIISAPLLIKR